MKYFLLILTTLLHLSGGLAQEIEISWDRDSVALGDQARLIYVIRDMEQTPGTILWDSLTVGPIDTSGWTEDMARSSFEKVGGAHWIQNARGDWQLTEKYQFWNTVYLQLHHFTLLNKDSTARLAEGSGDLLIYTHLPQSLRESTDPYPYLPPLPATPEIGTSLLRWLLIAAVFLGLVGLLLSILGRRRIMIKALDRAPYPSKQYLHHRINQLAASSQDMSTSQRYSRYLQELRYWMGQRYNVPAVEWTDDLLVKYLKKKKSSFLAPIEKILDHSQSARYARADMDRERIDEDINQILTISHRWAEETEMSILDRETLDSIDPILIEHITMLGYHLAPLKRRIILAVVEGILMLSIAFIIASLLEGDNHYLALARTYPLAAPVGLSLWIFINWAIAQSLWLYIRQTHPLGEFTGDRILRWEQGPFSYGQALKRTLMHGPLALLAGLNWWPAHNNLHRRSLSDQRAASYVIVESSSAS